jgi:hypothetical protein
MPKKRNIGGKEPNALKGSQRLSKALKGSQRLSKEVIWEK